MRCYKKQMQGEITFIRIIFKTPLFGDFFLGLVTADSDKLFAAVDVPQIGNGGICLQQRFGVWTTPSQLVLDAFLVQ